MKIKIQEGAFPRICAAAAFISAWGFFQFAYPAHLMRREQLDLFLYDWSYITRTYKGFGWLSHFAGDFVDQFLCFPVVGPVLIALILTAIGALAYDICRRVLQAVPSVRKSGIVSLAFAFLVFGWSFMRETGNIYMTQYSLSILIYLAVLDLAVILAGLRRAAAFVAVPLLLAAGIYSSGNPYHKYYGHLWGKPSMTNEKLIAIDVATAAEKWEKVEKLSLDNDLYVTAASYFYNLAIAKQGKLADGLFAHSQDYANGLFIWVTGESQFTDSVAGEVWYHMGNMTLAEQSSIVALQQSPKHTGARYIKRLAQITLITGEYGAAMKYLDMLSRTLRYRKWALSMMPQHHGPETLEWLSKARADLPGDDLIYDGARFMVDILKGLLDANPDNMMARQYLLTFQLLMLDVEGFMESYREKPIPGDIYSQAVLIWLSAHRMMSESEAAKYGVGRQTIQRLEQFYRYPERYRNTYWYYFMDLTTE